MTQDLPNQDRSARRTNPPWGRAIPLVVLAVAILAALASVRPPKATPLDAPETEFSSARAMRHVRSIAQEPHPVFSEEHDRVRDYLLRELANLGLDPQVQADSLHGGGNATIPIENILGRLEGTQPGRAVLLMCHYDSVPGAPGAADDASGVAAVLETVRAIRAGPPLRNDLIVLITDAEECGLLGARLFVQKHPWLDDVDLVLNFDARGNGGPVVLVEPSDDNGPLIEALARVAPHPFAQSFAVDVYRRMPNDTDFSILRQAGKSGLNFAFFKGLHYYHSARDTVENLDERSVEHFGSYCLPLARHFGNSRLEGLRGPDRIYFNVWGPWLAHYPLAWVKPLTIGIVIFTCLVVATGLRKRRISWGGAGAGTLTFLLCLVAAPAATTGAWLAILRIPGVSRSLSRGDAANADVFSAGFAALTLGVFAAIQAWAARRTSVHNRLAGALIIWLVLAIASSIYAPRGNYFLIWPLLFSACSLARLYAADTVAELGWWPLVAASLLTIPAIAWMVPGAYLIALTVGTTLFGVAALPITALLGLMIPFLDLARGRRWWIVPTGLSACAAILLGVGIVGAG